MGSWDGEAMEPPTFQPHGVRATGRWMAVAAVWVAVQKGADLTFKKPLADWRGAAYTICPPADRYPIQQGRFRPDSSVGRAVD
jgi:hypothetical protein